MLITIKQKPIHKINKETYFQIVIKAFNNSKYNNYHIITNIYILLYFLFFITTIYDNINSYLYIYLISSFSKEKGDYLVVLKLR